MSGRASPLVPGLASGKQLSDAAVEAVRFLLRVVPAEEHASLCDLIPQCAFVAWADHRKVITVDDIRARWDVNRATAYRWLAALGRKNGQEARAL